MNSYYFMTGLSETEAYLAHHGIKGQKWGLRRYQNSDGSLTEEGRKHYGVGPERNSKEERALRAKAERAERKAVAKAAKAEKKAAKKAEKTALKKAKSREEKMEFIRDHPKQIYRFRKELSEEDLKELMSKIEFDRKVKDIRDSEVQRGWDKMKQISNNLGTVKSLGENVKGLFNLSLDLSNWLVDNGKASGTRQVKLGEKPEKKEEDRSKYEKIVRTGTKEEVLANLGNLTSKELEDAMKRINYEEKLRKKD